MLKLNSIPVVLISLYNTLSSVYEYLPIGAILLPCHWRQLYIPILGKIY